MSTQTIGRSQSYTASSNRQAPFSWLRDLRATIAGVDFPNGASGTRANASGGAADVRQASAARKDKSLSRGSSDLDLNVIPHTPFAGSSFLQGFT